MDIPKDIFRDWLIVIIDDEPDAATILKQVLEYYGAVVHTAYHVPEAMNLILNEKPRMVITDLMMPGISGIDLRERLQAEGGSLASIPVVAMTAYLKPDDKKRFAHLGFRYFLAKPIIVQEVVSNLIEQLKDDLPDLRMRLDSPE